MKRGDICLHGCSQSNSARVTGSQRSLHSLLEYFSAAGQFGCRTDASHHTTDVAYVTFMTCHSIYPCTAACLSSEAVLIKAVYLGLLSGCRGSHYAHRSLQIRCFAFFCYCARPGEHVYAGCVWICVPYWRQGRACWSATLRVLLSWSTQNALSPATSTAAPSESMLAL